jgi:hypothetical protein
VDEAEAAGALGSEAGVDIRAWLTDPAAWSARTA